MFGFSIAKLIFTILAVVAVWYGFKWVGRMQEVRDQEARARVKRDAGAKPKKAAAAARDVEDMVKCDVCNAYVTASNTASCGRDDCPFPR